jgi:hypothetical protein
MLRALVLVVFLAAWLATGIVAGIVMGRRHNQFSWSLLGVAFGALMVPLALGRERREEPTGPAGSVSAPQDRSVPVLLSWCSSGTLGGRCGAARRPGTIPGKATAWSGRPPPRRPTTTSMRCPTSAPSGPCSTPATAPSVPGIDRGARVVVEQREPLGGRAVTRVEDEAVRRDNRLRPDVPLVAHEHRSPMISTGTLARVASLVARLPSRTLDIPAPLAPTTSKP